MTLEEKLKQVCVSIHWLAQILEEHEVNNCSLATLRQIQNAMHDIVYGEDINDT